MKPPLYVRPLTDAERVALRQGLRSPVAFTLRRCQVLLASADGLPPSAIAQAARRPDWVLGFGDETWWSRLAQPGLFAWAAGQPLRLAEQTRAKDGPQALSCYGLLRTDTDEMLLRFVEGRPVSQVTEDFLGWLCERFRKEGKRVFVLIWDNAS